MTTYRVTIFTEENYGKYMSGSNNYDNECVYVEANSKEEAVKKAQRTGYVVHTPSVKTFEEIQKEEERYDTWVADRTKKEAQIQAKRKATEARKAQEAGLTVEEYRKEKARKATITRLEREIAEIEKELKKKKASLKRIKNR